MQHFHYPAAVSANKQEFFGFSLKLRGVNLLLERSGHPVKLFFLRICEPLDELEHLVEGFPVEFLAFVAHRRPFPPP